MPRKRVPPEEPPYRDIFTDSERTWPMVLSDHTSVNFPRGWTPEMAAEWRRNNNLESPGARRAALKLVQKD
jgi:hypothetical protein